MLSLSNLWASQWSNKTSKKLWRGNGSGKWTYCGRGCNGQNSRSWGWVAQWFEWGQTPLFRRMPKLKGFSNARFKTKFNIINVDTIAKLAENWITEINREVLLETRAVRNKTLPIKLLWNGENLHNQ